MAMNLAQIQANIGDGRTPGASCALYGRLARSLKAIFGMEVLLNLAGTPGFPDVLFESRRQHQTPQPDRSLQ